MPCPETADHSSCSDSQTEQKCFYWVCASIIMGAEYENVSSTMKRAYAALSCAQREGCIRAGDCHDLTLSAIARLLQQRTRF